MFSCLKARNNIHYRFLILKFFGLLVLEKGAGRKKKKDREKQELGLSRPRLLNWVFLAVYVFPPFGAPSLKITNHLCNKVKRTVSSTRALFWKSSSVRKKQFSGKRDIIECFKIHVSPSFSPQSGAPPCVCSVSGLVKHTCVRVRARTHTHTNSGGPQQGRGPPETHGKQQGDRAPPALPTPHVQAYRRPL